MSSLPAASVHRWRATAGLLGVLVAMPAGAATITVTTTADASIVACTLRDAITAANTDAPSGACPAGAGDDTIDLTGVAGTIPLGTALPEVTSTVQILGPGATSLTIDGQDAVRVLRMTGGTVTIADLTIARGFRPAGDRGGGIFTSGGTLRLLRVVVRGCGAFNGGGILYEGGGTLTIEDSAIHDNRTTGNSGAGILVVGSVLVLTNSTVSANRIIAGLGQVGAGGGLSQVGGTATITNCTFAYNEATTPTGWSIANAVAVSPDDPPAATIRLANTIIFTPSAFDNCSGPIVSDGHNLSDDDSCDLNAFGDQRNALVNLGDLDDNGGPTPTIAVPSGSTAIDAADPALCPATDQRGVGRPVDGNADGFAVCDIGAFERGCDAGLAGGTPCGPDATPCTDDVCDGSGTCQHVDNTAACEDGDPCTLGDTCASGVCGAGAAVACPVVGGLTYQDCITGEIETGPTGTNACAQIGAATSIGTNSGLENLRAVALSPDGQSLYVVSSFDAAVARFGRDPASGALAYQDCVTGKLAAVPACTPIPAASADGGNSGLHLLQAVALSPDGRSLYAASPNDAAVARFDRDPATGALAYRDCITGESESGPTGTNACAAIATAAPSGVLSGLHGVRALAVSGDGRSVYAAGLSDVSHFDSDAATGALTYRGCISGLIENGPTGTNACAVIPSATADNLDTGLDTLLALALSADGKSLYAVAQRDDAVARFDRDPATGALTYRDCITGEAESGPSGTGACTAIGTASASGTESGLDGLFALALSPDGTSLYAVAQDDDAVARFDRDPTTGALTYRGCLTGELESGAPDPVPGTGACTEIRSVTLAGTSSGLDKPRSVAASADGRSVYVLSPQDDAVAHFVRDPATGALTYDRCLTGESETGPTGTNACDAIGSATARGADSGLDNPQAVALGPEGLSLYTASGNDAAVARFSVQPATSPPPPGDPQPISGALLLIADRAPRKRTIVFTSKDQALDADPGTGIDPVAAGAVLQVFNAAGTGDSACLGLPAAGWSVKGKGAKRTLRYRDKRSTQGPCRLAAVRDGKVLHVSCRAKTQPIDYSLDEPAQQSVGVRFRSGATEYCAVFGGNVVKDRQGRTFKAKRAPAPAACPVPPVACP